MRVRPLGPYRQSHRALLTLSHCHYMPRPIEPLVRAPRKPYFALLAKVSPANHVLQKHPNRHPNRQLRIQIAFTNQARVPDFADHISYRPS
jgi:hypothetical protein